MKQKRNIVKTGAISATLLTIAFVEVFKATVNFIWQRFLGKFWKSKIKTVDEENKNV